MITLGILCIIYTIIGWFITYKDYKKGKINTMDIFLLESSVYRILLALFTIVTVIMLLISCIRYLP